MVTHGVERKRTCIGTDVREFWNGMDPICKSAVFPVTLVRMTVAVLLLALMPLVAQAQMGRHFGSAEGYAGLARVIHVGKVVEVAVVAYEKPLEGPQKIGKPHRVVMEVGETIRGEAVKKFELVLALQTTAYLEYVRDHAIPVMLVGGPQRMDSFPAGEIGIEAQGQPVAGETYQFRVLDAVEVTESGDGAAAAVRQININYDSGRMFTNELGVVSGNAAILERVRAFSKKHPEALAPVTLQVPNEFGRLVGDPGAYCSILFPICPETRATLEAVRKDPGIILRRIKVPNVERSAEAIVAEVEKALAGFPVK